MDRLADQRDTPEWLRTMRREWAAVRVLRPPWPLAVNDPKNEEQALHMSLLRRQFSDSKSQVPAVKCKFGCGFKNQDLRLVRQHQESCEQSPAKLEAAAAAAAAKAKEEAEAAEAARQDQEAAAVEENDEAARATPGQSGGATAAAAAAATAAGGEPELG